ncbi:hypothetical protein [Rubellimicrobium roseum]|uniref:Uncharacterized protein n=1 Tax=Rubellimicrobium roseum TaxID=687525 RepID=A0A5C4N7S5_9RHOB|nr:hypothetical protein [Rubellimicrobium roseum]TNC59305.1 hypothetical protein FHG71_22960 [Rubellimicrobium roseum]
MSILKNYVARRPAAELEPLRAAARRFEAMTGGAVTDALPIDAWLVGEGSPPLVFAWPADAANTQEVLYQPLIGVRPQERLFHVPSGWLRIVSPVSDRRRRELEWGEELARELRNALLRPEGGGRP